MNGNKVVLTFLALSVLTLMFTVGIQQLRTDPIAAAQEEAEKQRKHTLAMAKYDLEGKQIDLQIAQVSTKIAIEKDPEIVSARVWRIKASIYVPVIALCLSPVLLLILKKYQTVPIQTSKGSTRVSVRKAEYLIEQQMISERLEATSGVQIQQAIQAGVESQIENTATMLRSVKPFIPKHQILAEPSQKALPQTTGHVPTFAELYATDQFANLTSFPMGFTADMTMQYRRIEDLRTMSVAGEQGSGKTATMAYLDAITILMSPKSEVFVVDPHWKHPKGLGPLVQPLTATGRLHLINPLELEQTIDLLNLRLNRRLAGEESSDDLIVLNIDELAQVSKMDCFPKKVLPLIERFTEETRKAGMIGIFGSQKWNARHFGGKADVRACMNSFLVHPIKPSQADLILEDRENARMMKQVSRPGQALMSTSFRSDPSIVTLPLITRQDIAQIAQRLTPETTIAPLPQEVELPVITATPPATTELQGIAAVAPNFAECVRTFIKKKQEENPEYSQNKFAAEVGLKPYQISRMLSSGKISEEMQQQMQKVMQG